MDDYEVKDGRIVSPGKFEGEPAWAPFFWDLVLQGDGEETEDGWTAIEVLPDDHKRFPGLLPSLGAVLLRESDDGFIYTSTEER